MTDRVKILFNIYGDGCGSSFAGNVYDKEELSPSIMTMGGAIRNL